MGSTPRPRVLLEKRIIMVEERVNRHPEYVYMIKLADEKDKWVYIGEPNSEGWEEDMMSAFEDEGPVEFLKRITEKEQWTIAKYDDAYGFKEDPLKIRYRWDDLFGFTAIVDDWAKIDEVTEFLNKYCVTEATLNGDLRCKYCENVVPNDSYAEEYLNSEIDSVLGVDMDVSLVVCPSSKSMEISLYTGTNMDKREYQKRVPIAFCPVCGRKL